MLVTNERRMSEGLSRFIAVRTGGISLVLLFAGFVTDWGLFKNDFALSLLLWSLIICSISTMTYVIVRHVGTISR